ncbi:unnamed protein product, partial [Amoebophrya sp. A120]
WTDDYQEEDFSDPHGVTPILYLDLAGRYHGPNNLGFGKLRIFTRRVPLSSDDKQKLA